MRSFLCVCVCCAVHVMGCQQRRANDGRRRRRRRRQRRNDVFIYFADDDKRLRVTSEAFYVVAAVAWLHNVE